MTTLRVCAFRHLSVWQSSSRCIWSNRCYETASLMGYWLVWKDMWWWSSCSDRHHYPARLRTSWAGDIIWRVLATPQPLGVSSSYRDHRRVGHTYMAAEKLSNNPHSRPVPVFKKIGLVIYQSYKLAKRRLDVPTLSFLTCCVCSLVTLPQTYNCIWLHKNWCDCMERQGQVGDNVCEENWGQMPRCRVYSIWISQGCSWSTNEAFQGLSLWTCELSGKCIYYSMYLELALGSCHRSPSHN